MYTIGLLSLVACLPKYWGNQCLEKGNCAPFKVVEDTAPSPVPFEISRDDISLETRLSNFQLTERGLLAATETRETCRALHLSTRTYQLKMEKWYHKPYKNFRLKEDRMVDGEYQACSEWTIDNDIQVASHFTTIDGKPKIAPLQKTRAHVQIPFVNLGWGMMSNPQSPTLSFVVEDSNTPPFEMLLPERNGDWLCAAIPTIDRIVAKEDFTDWTIQINVEDQKIKLPYIHDTEPRLLHLKNEIQACDAYAQKYLQGIILTAANENPESYGHLNYLYQGLFGKKLTGVRRSKRVSTGKASTKNASSRSSRSIVGTYRCNHNGDMAYMKIYRNGVFNLKLELKSGSAQGVCSGNTCSIESINNNAVAFTGGVNTFSVKRSGNALIMNNSVRCEKRS